MSARVTGPSQANVSFPTLFLGGRFFDTFKFTPLNFLLINPLTEQQTFITIGDAVAWRPEDMYVLIYGRLPGEGV